MWKVYILVCSDNTLYTGITTNIERRLNEHNGLLPGGAKYTRFRQPVELVYLEEAFNRSEASIIESKIKKLSKNDKLKLIDSKSNIYSIAGKNI